MLSLKGLEGIKNIDMQELSTFDMFVEVAVIVREEEERLKGFQGLNKYVEIAKKTEEETMVAVKNSVKKLVVIGPRIPPTSVLQQDLTWKTKKATGFRRKNRFKEAVKLGSPELSSSSGFVQTKYKKNALMFGSQSPNSVLQHCLSKKPDGITEQPGEGILFPGMDSSKESVKLGIELVSSSSFGFSGASSSSCWLNNCSNSPYVNKESIVSEQYMMPVMKGRKRCYAGCQIDGQKETQKAKWLKGKEDSDTPDTKTDDDPVLDESFQSIVDGMGGTNVKFLIRKKLYAADLDKVQARLSMPKRKVHGEFLEDSEKERLKKYYPAGRYLMEVPVMVLIEPNLHQSYIKLKEWDYENRRNSSYVLNGTWKNVYERNKLVVGDIIEVWSFRKNSDLCMVLVCKSKKIERCSCEEQCNKLEKAGNFQA